MSLMSMFPGGGGTNNQPLKAPTNLYAVMDSASSIQITWADPENEYSQPSGVLIGEWMFTRLVRKIGSAPVNANDGELIVESAVKNQYQTIGFVDSNNIVTGTTYYYAAFAFTTSRVSSPGAVFMIKASYYDPVLNNNSWSAIHNACAEGVASSLWSVGDTKTENGVSYTLQQFNPTVYPLSDGSGSHPYAIFVTSTAVSPGGYTSKQQNYVDRKEAEKTYLTSRLRSVIESYYNSMGAELKQYIPQVNVSLWRCAENSSYTVGADELETIQAYTFPLGETAIPSILPTASSRQKGRAWWTGDIAECAVSYPGSGLGKVYCSAAVMVGENGTLNKHTQEGTRQDYSRGGTVFGFCFGKAGA